MNVRRIAIADALVTTARAWPPDTPHVGGSQLAATAAPARLDVRCDDGDDGDKGDD